MKQHVISSWLLSAFARPSPGGATLLLYDKSTDDYQETTPDDYRIEVNAHSAEIERGIEAIETPASHAARRLAKRVRRMAPGFYALVDEAAEVRASGEPVADIGVVEGMQLFVSQLQLPSPSRADRLALATYIGLMYQRAPKVEAAIMRWGLEFDKAAQASLDRWAPGMRTGLSTTFAKRRDRMLGSAPEIGARLAAASWWVVRPADSETFVLGDCPVAATLALGHDDTWRAIFATESYVVVMPLGPKIAVVIAPQTLVPIANIGPEDVPRAINRLTWRSADRHVLARDRTALDAALPGADASLRRSTIEVSLDGPGVAAAATAESERIIGEVFGRLLARHIAGDEPRWPHWEGCRLVFVRKPGV